MTAFATYIERQKSIIRQRHFGQEVLIVKGEEIHLSRSEQIFKDFGEMKGLNTAERLGAIGKRVMEN